MRGRCALVLLAMATTLTACGASSTTVVTVVVTVPPAASTPNTAATATRTVELAQLATALAPTAPPAATPRPAITPPPSVSAGSPTAAAASTTPVASTLKVVAQGYGQNERSVGYAFVVENADPKTAIDFTQYRVSAYDATGKVVRTDASYIAVVYPGQRLGIAGELYLPQNVRIINVDFDVSGGRTRPFDGASPLAAENVLFQGDPLSGGLVTGVVRSTFPQDLKNVTVSAIAYDARGVIIGGGQKLIDRVPASNIAAAEVPVTLTGQPARVEMYPTISL